MYRLRSRDRKRSQGKDCGRVSDGRTLGPRSTNKSHKCFKKSAADTSLTCRREHFGEVKRFGKRMDNPKKRGLKSGTKSAILVCRWFRSIFAVLKIRPVLSRLTKTSRKMPSRKARGSQPIGFGVASFESFWPF